MALTNAQVYPKEQLALNPNIDPNATFGAPITSTAITPVSTPTFQTPGAVQVPDISKIDTTQLQLVQQEKDLSSLMNQIVSAQTAFGGKTAYTQEQQQKYGLNDIQNAQNDLNTQIESIKLQSEGLKNQANTIPSRITQGAIGTEATQTGLAPITAGELRKNQIQQADLASQALILQASLLGTQGKLASAQRNIDQAVAAKFGPQEEDLKIKLANLEVLSKDPSLTIAQQNRANAQALALKQQQEILAKNKENYNGVQTEGIKAAANVQNFTPTPKYPTYAVAFNAISQAGTPFEAAQIAASVGLTTKQSASNTTVVEVNGKKLLINDLTGATIKELGATGPSSTSVVEVNGQKILINDKTGETIKTLGQKSSSTNNFTSTQLNTGAAHAAVGLDEFKAFDGDIQNFFIHATANNLTDLKNAIKAVKNGEVVADDAKSEIDGLALSSPVKNYFKTLIDKNTPKSEIASIQTQSNPLTAYFKDVWSGLKGLFGQ